jgi:multidrug resistance efflux pump
MVSRFIIPRPTRQQLVRGVAVAALLVGAALALGLCWPGRHRPAALHLPGTVEVQEVRLGPKTGGRVAEVLAREGELAEAGQVLVRFEAPELEAQCEQWQARLRAAEAQLEKTRNGPRDEEKEAARAAVAAAQARWERLRAGARPEEIRQAQGELAGAEADFRLAGEEFDRADRLLRRGAVSPAQHDAARAARDQARARADVARARLDLLRAGSRPEEVAEAAAELRRARANEDLVTSGTGPEDLAEAEARVAEARGKLREVEATLREAAVTAPERVVVEVLAVRKGDLVPPNQPVVRVLRAADLWVKAYVPETDLARVRLGQSAQVALDGYPGRRFAGTVVQIAGDCEFTPRNVQSVDERRHQVFGIKVRVADPDGIFKSGLAADVLLPVEEGRP